MESVSFSKSDLKILFALSMTIPLMSFIFGFFLAQKSEPTASISPATYLTSEALQPTENAPSIDIDDTDGMQTIVVSKTTPRASESQSIQPVVKTDTPKVKSVTPDPSEVVSNSPTPTVKRYIVQAGLFASVENAKKFTQTLTKSGLTPQIIRESNNDASLFRVFVDSFASQKDAWSYTIKMKREHSISLVVTDTHSAKLKDLIAAR